MIVNDLLSLRSWFLYDRKESKSKNQRFSYGFAKQRIFVIHEKRIFVFKWLKSRLDVCTFQNNGTATVSSGATLTIEEAGIFDNKLGATFTNNGTLGGNGTFIQTAGATFTNAAGSTVGAGSSPGTLTITGDIALASSTLYAEINGTTASTQYDVLSVSGTTTITNGSSKLVLDFGFTPTVNAMFDIVVGGGTVTGTFAAGDISIPNGGAGSVSVTYPGGGIVRVEVLTLVPLTPEMDVLGNNVSIMDGDASPSTVDDTDFGTVNQNKTNSKTFTIKNTGGGTLNLTGTPIVAVSGSSNFTIETQPPSSVAGDASTTFVIKFAPTSLGVITSTISIDNNDSDENPYTFDVKGTGDVVFLPVELVSFKVQLQDRRTYLTWQTATEIINEGFEIQRAASNAALEADRWEVLAFVEGNGTTNEVQNYRYTDERPQAGLNYYRLKQIDFDGKFEFSDIVSVEVRGDGEEGIQIFPNPASSGELTLYLPESNENKALIRLYDQTGRLALQQTTSSQQETLNVSQLVSGIYFVEVRVGRKVFREKVVVK